MAPYRYHLNGPVHIMTARKRVGRLPTHCLAMRHSVDYSSSDHFSLDDSLRDSSSSSSSETSSNSSADALSDPASSRSSFDHSLPTPSLAANSDRPISRFFFCEPSCRGVDPLCMSGYLLSSPTLRALSYARADLLPSPKRIRSPKTATDLEGCSKDSFEPYVPRRDRDDARVVVEAIDREKIETGMKGPVEVKVDRVTHPVVADDISEPAQKGDIEVMYETLRDLVQRFHDHTEEIQIHRVQVIESVQRDQGHRIVTTGQQRQCLTPIFEHQDVKTNCRLHRSIDSSSSSSSETSLDSSADALSDSASSRSSSNHSLPTPSSGMRPSHHLCSLVPSIHRSFAAISDRPSHDSSSTSPSRKRSRSPAASVPLSSPIPGALSYARANLLPSPKRIRSPESATDLEGCSEDSFKPYVPRETGLGVDFEDESSEPSRSRRSNLEEDVDVVRSDGIDIDPEIQAEIDECIAYVDALRDRGIDARVVVEAIDREEIETGMRGPVEVRVDRVTHPVVDDDIPEPAQEGAVEVTYKTLGDLVQRFHDHTEEILVHHVQAIESVQRVQGYKIVVTRQQSADMLERIRELEQDNMRLRDMMDVARQRVARSQHKELRVQGEMRQIRRFRFYDRMRIARLEACARRHLGQGLTYDLEHQGHMKELTNKSIVKWHAARNLEPLMRDGGEHEEISRNGVNGNEGNRNGGNGNGNGNGGGNGYNFGGFMPARECTYQDFLKCQPLSFNGIEGVVGLTHWFEKMETVFHISNCPEKYQVKYATCMLLNSTLTWWNSHKRTIRIEAAYAMSWA
ncbi:hypothetical protein Tco_0266130 [Tanacetum coccineum]